MFRYFISRLAINMCTSKFRLTLVRSKFVIQMKFVSFLITKVEKLKHVTIFNLTSLLSLKIENCYCTCIIYVVLLCNQLSYFPFLSIVIYCTVLSSVLCCMQYSPPINLKFEFVIMYWKQCNTVQYMYSPTKHNTIPVQYNTIINIYFMI